MVYHCISQYIMATSGKERPSSKYTGSESNAWFRDPKL